MRAIGPNQSLRARQKRQGVFWSHGLHLIRAAGVKVVVAQIGRQDRMGVAQDLGHWKRLSLILECVYPLNEGAPVSHLGEHARWTINLSIYFPHFLLKLCNQVILFRLL